MPATSFDIVAAMAYALIEEVVFDSFQILASEFHWQVAMPEWNDRLQFLGQVAGLTLDDLRLQTLGDGPRLVHIEPNEESI